MKNTFTYPADIGLHRFPSSFTVDKNKYTTILKYIKINKNLLKTLLKTTVYK